MTETAPEPAERWSPARRAQVRARNQRQLDRLSLKQRSGSATPADLAQLQRIHSLLNALDQLDSAATRNPPHQAQQISAARTRRNSEHATAQRERVTVAFETIRRLSQRTRKSLSRTEQLHLKQARDIVDKAERDRRDGLRDVMGPLGTSRNNQTSIRSVVSGGLPGLGRSH